MKLRKAIAAARAKRKAQTKPWHVPARPGWSIFRDHPRKGGR